ncbi:MAG: hypothetical protein ACKO2K_16080, partial [Alphaproteobacteria bacterium]
GKTTLLLHLVARGRFGLVSNDRVIVMRDGAGWATCGVPAPLRIRPGTLAGLASLPSWAASLDRPYLHSLAEAREASREIETRSSAPHLEAVLGTAQVADWLGCEVVARSPLTALVFPELRGDARGFGVDL